MTSTKNSAFLSNRRLSFMLGLLLVLAWTVDPLLAQRGSGGGRGTHSGPRVGDGRGGHPGHFGTHSGGQGFGGHRSFQGFGRSDFSFGLGFHAGDFAFGGRDGFIGGPVGDHGFSRGFGFGGPYRRLGHGYTLYPGNYGYGMPAYGYESRSSYSIRPSGDRGDPAAGQLRSHPNEPARLDLRSEPARLILLIPPTRAEVYLDGRLIGIAAELRHRDGFLIDAGKHRLETVHPTFENQTFDFSAEPGETVELE